jgi:hypothetical protein
MSLSFMQAWIDRLFLEMPAWSPADVATTAWYDATDTNTITASGDAVSVWQDKSSNGNHATQSTPANQPATGGDINGRNAIAFDAAGPNHLLTPLEQLTTVSLYVVGDYTARGANAYGGYIGANAAGYAENSGLLWRLEDYSTSAIRTYDPVYTFSDSVTNRWVNGSYQATPVFGIAMFSHQGTGLPTANHDYFIGSSRGDFSTMWGLDGSIGEIIICPEEHDLATRQKMEGYLAHKWGLATNLPALHPYKDFDPQGGMTAVSVALTNATVSDTDSGDVITQNWELVSKPAGAPDPTFSSSTVINPTVTFTASGIYELRLTANDGYGPISDELIIMVNESGSISTTNYSVPHTWLSDFDPAWSNDYETAVLDDQDGDGVSTWEEYWSGTDPSDSNSILRIQSVSLSGGELILQWSHAAISGPIPPIEVQATTNIAAGIWSVADTYSPTNGINDWSRPKTTQGIYYRLKATPVL